MILVARRSRWVCPRCYERTAIMAVSPAERESVSIGGGARSLTEAANCCDVPRRSNRLRALHLLYRKDLVASSVIKTISMDVETPETGDSLRPGFVTWNSRLHQVERGS